MRTSEEVVGQLLRAMQETVTSYHPTVNRTAETLEGLIAGTACFPGGAGVWRGDDNGGSLPKLFPQSAVMFVGHNFDSDRGYVLSLSREGEVEGQFWKRLLRVIAGAGLAPEECFFTNALMGLKPGKAEGKMPLVAGYSEQCQRILQKQIEIVQPRAIVALGVKAERHMRSLGAPYLAIKHPGDWDFRELVTRELRLLAEGERVREFLTGQPSASSRLALTMEQCQVTRAPATQEQVPTTRVGNIGVKPPRNGTDAWGFRLGTYNYYLMSAIEAGGKSKETIRSEFLHTYPEASGKSTFGVFFSDVIRAFGSASVSRGIRIEINAKEHLSFDPHRAAVVKSAIAKGLLAELNRVDNGAYPKKNLAAIEKVQRNFEVPLKQ
jgi:hypothetical protein